HGARALAGGINSACAADSRVGCSCLMSFFQKEPPLRAKICGLTSPEDAETALGCGADALGFNFFPGSKRFIDFAESRDWIAALAGRTQRIAVVVNASTDELALLRDSGCFEAVQF